MQISLVATIITTIIVTVSLIVAFRHRSTSHSKMRQRSTPFDQPGDTIASENRAANSPSFEHLPAIVDSANEQIGTVEEIGLVIHGSVDCSTEVLDTAEAKSTEKEIKQEEMAVPNLYDHPLSKTADSTELQPIEILVNQGTFAIDITQHSSNQAAISIEFPKHENEPTVAMEQMRPASSLLDEPVRESSQSYGRDAEASAGQIRITRKIRHGNPSPQSELYVEPSSESRSAAIAGLLSISSPTTEPDVQAVGPQTDPDTRRIASPPTYHPPAHRFGFARMTGQRERLQPEETASGGELRLRLQLVFGRDGAVKVLAVIPDKGVGMPSEVQLVGAEADLCLVQLQDDSYEPLPLPDAANVLQRGVAWHGKGAIRGWRWTLSGREIYVLAPGDEFGFHGFVSIPRLRLNARHVVLCTAALKSVVFAALENAGCISVAMSKENAAGVPSGWVLFREVMPLRSVAMMDEKHILNVLCPLSDAELHFVGGIRLERNKWLAGFPPRIHITGEVYDGFKVMIDGQRALRTADSTYEAPDWNAEGEHNVVFGDRTTSYQLCRMLESWEHWPAHDFGRGAAICGAAVRGSGGRKSYTVRVPVTNSVILGCQPGEVFYLRLQNAIRCDMAVALVPFEPVWALPADTLHVDKRSARIVLLNPIAPLVAHDCRDSDAYLSSSLIGWLTALNDARRKQLAVDPRTEAAVDLWRQYRILAKQMWRRMR